MASHTHSAFERLEIVETGRRRRWSVAEKRRIILESLASPRQVSATARRHGLSRSLLVTWRRAFLASREATLVKDAAPPAALFSPVVVSPAVTPSPVIPAASLRLEITLRCGRRILVDGAFDLDAILKLAQGLEALP